MKYCVSNRVSPATLEKADEIKVGFRDRRALPDYFEKYPVIATTHPITIM